MMRFLQRLLGISSVTLAASHAADLTAIPFETIQGEKTSLADFKGKVVLVVNTAGQVWREGLYRHRLPLQ
jgi:hypothetical protein